jgi:AbrB family looped-hinge helix DNA binding protein
MAYDVKVTRQCQTTIPRAIRKKYGIDEGDSIIYVDLGDHIAMVPVSKHPIKDLKKLNSTSKNLFLKCVKKPYEPLKSF